MKKILIFLLITAPFLYSFDQIIKWDKSVKTSETIIFQDGKFISKEGDVIDRSEVSLIKFNLKEPVESEKSDIIGEVTPNELKRRADILQEKYPDNAKLILLDEGYQRMNIDGSQYSRSRYSLKINSEKDLNEANLSFYSQPGEYESRIIMARSIDINGEVSYLSLDDVTYASPSQGLEYFSGKKDTKIIKAVIPNVKVGSIIDFEWETLDLKPEDKNQFYTHWYFGGDDPVFESKVSYIVPENREFYWVAKNFDPYDPSPEISKKEGYKIYKFSRGECPPFVAEPQSPPMWELIPFVFGSTYKDQTYLSQWLAGFFKERMRSNDKIKATVDEVVKNSGARTEEEIVAALYRFTQEFIHYRSIKTSISSGLAGHPATETFENRYGDCIDKSIFFATILGLVGVEAYPVIVRTNDQPRPLYGELGVISGNHAINEIHLKQNGNKIIYLDSTSVTYKYPNFRSDNHGIPVWNPILNTVREIDPPDPEFNKQVFNTRINLKNDNSAEIFKENIYKGELDAGLRQYFLSMKDKEIESLFVSLSGRDYPGSKLKGYEYSALSDYKSDFSIKYNFASSQVLKKSGEYYIFTLPIKYSFSFTSFESRKYPLKYNTTSAEIRSVTLELPEGYKVRGIPEGLSIKSDILDYVSNYSLENNVLKFTDEFVRKKTVVNVNEYKQFRKNLLEVEHSINIPIVLEKSE